LCFKDVVGKTPSVLRQAFLPSFPGINDVTDTACLTVPTSKHVPCAAYSVTHAYLSIDSPPLWCRQLTRASLFNQGDVASQGRAQHTVRHIFWLELRIENPYQASSSVNHRLDRPQKLAALQTLKPLRCLMTMSLST